MNTAIIMLGSNTRVEKNMELALNKLTKHFEIIDTSPQVQTEPVGIRTPACFNNKALKITSDKNLDETIAIFKQIEQEAGRKPNSKLTGIIPMDIDMIFWNDLQVHDDYNRFEYVKNCVNEIK
ncbi:MAG: 2-amino-4-hydroxy-6-hydroxymethyldihydropteridine diphosphokinase [Paludibacter sp.]|nr:2-amino-4-hydroxy-6-hydroxymethyldihydropteridine diphosphokinase [Paludibacter sp.]